MASTVTFSGGIHPVYWKGLSQDRAVQELAPPAVAVVPLSQHIGAPARAVVEVGARVLVGQVVAEAAGFVSVPVHAPVSGTVVAIEPRPHPLGKRLEAIVIEGDGTDQWVEPLPPLDPETAPAKELVERIRDAGIVGLGGAAFPTHVKLSPPGGKPIDTVILNGAECEPYLTADHRLMVETPERVIEGALIVARALGAPLAIVAVEENKPDAVQALIEAAGGTEITVVVLEAKYPQGAEKQLISAVLGRTVPAGGLPMDVRVVVHNVGTARAVSEAVRDGRPLVRRVVTVTGSIVREPANLLVRIGTPVARLIEAAGGLTAEPGKLILGGPMMGVAQHSDEVPVIKGTSGVLALATQEVIDEEEGPCIRCGACARGCPMHLCPSDLNALSEAGRFEEAEGRDALDCIECGACAWGCPAHLRLVQRIRHAKAEILAARRKAKGKA